MLELPKSPMRTFPFERFVSLGPSLPPRGGR
jgi:hypothetical protein